jgi:hypothetical protein
MDCSLNPSDVSIKAGEWKLGYDLKHEEPLPFEIVQVDSIVPHPNYQPGSASFDTALLFLQSAIKLDQHVDTICIGDAPAVTPQRKCISTGWGKTILQSTICRSFIFIKPIDILIIPTVIAPIILLKSRFKYYLLSMILYYFSSFTQKMTFSNFTLLIESPKSVYRNQG